MYFLNSEATSPLSAGKEFANSFNVIFNSSLKSFAKTLKSLGI
jgi:hypothetical protein